MRGPERRAPLRLTVRTIRVGLGALWILDGLLQLQPKMFGTDFATMVLAPAAQGQPAVIAWPIDRLVLLVSHQPVGYDLVFAGVQVLIGIGLLGRATVKPALILSFAWVGGVWALGEGFGMLLTGSASPLTGAPGGVLLYGLLGVVVWPRRRPVEPHSDGPGSPAGGGLLGDGGARVAWAALWTMMGALWLLPANRGTGAVSAQIRDAAQSSPSWFSHLQLQAAHSVGGAGFGLAATLALVSMVIGIGPLVARSPVVCLVAGVALSVDFWLLGQSMGGFATGLATDPNSAPLVVLLALALFPNHGTVGLASRQPATEWSGGESRPGWA